MSAEHETQATLWGCTVFTDLLKKAGRRGHLQHAALGLDVAPEERLGVLALGHIQLRVAQVEDPPPRQQERSLCSETESPFMGEQHDSKHDEGQLHGQTSILQRQLVITDEARAW